MRRLCLHKHGTQNAAAFAVEGLKAAWDRTAIRMFGGILKAKLLKPAARLAVITVEISSHCSSLLEVARKDAE